MNGDSSGRVYCSRQLEQAQKHSSKQNQAGIKSLTLRFALGLDRAVTCSGALSTANFCTSAIDNHQMYSKCKQKWKKHTWFEIVGAGEEEVVAGTLEPAS